MRQIYERMVRTQRMPPAQQNRMYFDLFYPFFRYIVNVDEIDRPQTAPRRPQPPASTAGAVGPSTGSWATPLHTQAPPPAHGYPFFGSSAQLANAPSSAPWASYYGGPAYGAVSRAAGQRNTVPPSLGSVGFVGKPVSPSVVGSALGFPMQGVTACSLCPGNPVHSSFECPIRYFRKTGQPCPGIDSSGNRVQAAWNGNNINSQTKAAWRMYIPQHGLQDAHRAGGRAVNFS